MPPQLRKRKPSALKSVTDEAMEELKPVDQFETIFYNREHAGREEDNDDDVEFGKKRKAKTKPNKGRKRHKGVKIEDRESIEVPDVSEHEFDPAEDTLEEHRLNKPPSSIRVDLVNSPGGPQLRLNLADILTQGVVTTGISKIQGFGAARTATRAADASKKISSPASLTSLPLELASKIYRLVFVSEEPIDFTERKDFERSAALLRTCRKIHDEGTIVLYGENAFHFTRSHHTRGSYKDSTWCEIGYKDVRRFLSDIGPHNMAKLKYASFVFEDALPHWTPDMTHESRKYYNNPVLVEVLNMIAQNTILEKFAVGFRGKTHLTMQHYQFLKALCSIRCYDFVNTDSFGPSHIDYCTKNKLERVMRLPKGLDTDDVDQEKKFVPKMMHDVVRRGLRRPLW